MFVLICKLKSLLRYPKNLLIYLFLFLIQMIKIINYICRAAYHTRSYHRTLFYRFPSEILVYYYHHLTQLSLCIPLSTLAISLIVHYHASNAPSQYNVWLISFILINKTMFWCIYFWDIVHLFELIVLIL
jgi:hypothetical protein